MFCSDSETDKQKTLPSWQDLSSDGGAEATGCSVPTPRFCLGLPVLKLAHGTHQPGTLETRRSHASPRPVHALWDLAKNGLLTVYPVQTVTETESQSGKSAARSVGSLLLLFILRGRSD